MTLRRLIPMGLLMPVALIACGDDSAATGEEGAGAGSTVSAAAGDAAVTSSASSGVSGSGGDGGAVGGAGGSETPACETSPDSALQCSPIGPLEWAGGDAAQQGELCALPDGEWYLYECDDVGAPSGFADCYELDGSPDRWWWCGHSACTRYDYCDGPCGTVLGLSAATGWACDGDDAAALPSDCVADAGCWCCP